MVFFSSFSHHFDIDATFSYPPVEDCWRVVVPNLLETALLQCARTFCFDRDLQDSQCESYFENISNLIYIYIMIFGFYQYIRKY